MTGGNGLQYLSGIASYVGTTENYTISINQGQPLYSPAGVSFSTTGLLAAVTTNGLGYTYNFTYDTTLNDGDLTEVQFPQGGHLRWTYTNCAYPGPATVREVQYPYLLSNTQQGEETYTFTPGNGTSTTLDDASGAERYWAYSGGWLNEIQYRPSPGATPVRHEYYTWVQDPTSLNYYIGTLKTVLNEGQTYSQTTQTVQTQDSYGNVLATNIYDYGNLNTPARTYANTYLYQSNGNYSPLYIYNRLLTSTLTSASPNITLVSNQYDWYGTCQGGWTPYLLSPNGNPHEWDVANYGNTCFFYRGNVTQANTPGKTINSSYDTTGSVVEQDDNNGHSVNVTTSTATNFTLPDTLSPNGTASLQTAATYNTPNFLPTSVAGPGQTLNNGTAGTAAYTSYDSYGRVAYTLAPSQATGQLGAQTNYTYGYASGGWTVTATTANSAPSNNGTSHFTTTTLDGLGRTVSVQTGTGTGTTVLSEVDTTYAPCACGPIGKMSWQSQPYAPPNSAPPDTAYSYDALGRTTNVLLADGGSHTTYTYQGNFTTVTDPASKWKQYASDIFGNLVTVLEPDPTANPVPGPPNPPPAYPVTAAPSGMLLTSYTYDQVSHLTQVAMPRGTVTQKRTFTYTPTTYSTANLPALWLTSTTNPENGTVSYTYNADGTLASKKDANGNTETYTYDAYQRLTAIPDRQQTITYDTCPTTNATGCVGMPGQLVQATFGSNIGPNQLSFEYNYAYTPAGKVSSKTLGAQSANHYSMWGVLASATLTASYTYDNQGAPTSVAYPQSSPSSFTYTLDAMERPTAMTDQNSYAWASGATYNAANQPLNDGTATRAYNRLHQVTSIVGPQINMTYTYSPGSNNGQVASSVDAVSGETITYKYDALKRLSSASGKNWGETYTYDGYGNLTQMSPTGTAGAPALSVTVALDANGNPTNQISATGVAYDYNGNQTARFGGLSLTYDAANRISAVGGSQSAAYAYDTDNRRIYSRDASGNETIYFYGVDGKKQATYTSTIVANSGEPYIQLTVKSINLYFLGKLIIAEGYDVSTDRLGSVRSSQTGYEAQYPYGVEYTTTANDREKYATYTRDSVTGLDYAVNRYYSSQWGRFLSPDPYGGSAFSGNPQSWNRYAYVSSDPIGANDPTGLDNPCPDGCIIYIPRPPGTPGPGGPGGGGSGGGGGPTPCIEAAPGIRMDPFFVPCGGGGGGGVSSETARERAVLAARINKLGNCTKVLAGVSASNFLKVANTIQYFNGSPGAPGSGRTQNSVSGNGVSESLAVTVQGDVADTLMGAQGTPIPYVVLGVDFYNDPDVSQPNVLLHEALHVALGLAGPGDADLKTYLSQFGFVSGYGNPGGTDDITQWLQDNCPNQRHQ